MKKILDFGLIITLFLFLTNIYIFNFDLQIARAINIEIGSYFARNYLRPFVAFFTLYILFSEFLQSDTTKFKKFIMWLPILIILLVPPYFGESSMSNVLIEVAGEAAVLLLVIAAFHLPNFDKIFIFFASLYILISLGGCALDNPYFQMSASHEFGCRGLAAHRNSFGALVNFLLIYFLAVMRPSLWRLFLVLICLWLSVNTFSIGSYLVSAFIGLFLLTRQFFERTGFHRMPMLTVLIVFGICGLVLAPTLLDVVIDFTDRSVSFALRIQIFDALSGMSDYVFWGEGYKSTPSTAIQSELVRVTNWDDASGMHNSFLSLWRQIGIVPATILLAIFLILLCITAARSTFAEPEGFYATIALAIYLLFGLWESGYGPYNSIPSLVCMRLIYLYHQTLRQIGPLSDVSDLKFSQQRISS